MVGRKRTILALAVFLAIALLPGCSAETQKWILATFFDDVDTPPPPTHRVRRDLDRELEELKRKLAEADQKLAAAQEAAKGGKGAAEGSAPPVEKARVKEVGSTRAAVRRGSGWGCPDRIPPCDRRRCGRRIRDGKKAPCWRLF